MRKIKPDLQAQPIGAVIEDYYDRHVGLGARPMVFIVNKRLKEITIRLLVIRENSGSHQLS